MFDAVSDCCTVLLISEERLLYAPHLLFTLQGDYWYCQKKMMSCFHLDLDIFLWDLSEGWILSGRTMLPIWNSFLEKGWYATSLLHHVSHTHVGLCIKWKWTSKDLHVKGNSFYFMNQRKSYRLTLSKRVAYSLYTNVFSGCELFFNSLKWQYQDNGENLLLE